MKKMLLGLAIASAFNGYHAEAEAAQAAGSPAETKGKKEKPKVEVQMEDGRKVQFPQDTKAQKDIIYKDATGNLVEKGHKDAQGDPIGVRWDFSNGKTRTILLSELAPLAATLQAHGLSQKGGDEYASEKDVDDAVMAFDDLMDRLKKGEWSERREGGFGGASVLAKAIANVFGKSPEEVRAFLRDLSPAEKLAMRQAPELKPEIEKIEAEKAKGQKVDTAALLAKAKALSSAPAATQAQ